GALAAGRTACPDASAAGGEYGLCLGLATGAEHGAVSCDRTGTVGAFERSADRLGPRVHRGSVSGGSVGVGGGGGNAARTHAGGPPTTRRLHPHWFRLAVPGVNNGYVQGLNLCR